MSATLGARMAPLATAHVPVLSATSAVRSIALTIVQAVVLCGLAFALERAALWQVTTLGSMVLRPLPALLLASLLRQQETPWRAALPLLAGGFLARFEPGGLLGGQVVALLADALQAALAAGAAGWWLRGSNADMTRMGPCATVLAIGTVAALGVTGGMYGFTQAWPGAAPQAGFIPAFGFANVTGILVCLPWFATIRQRLVGQHVPRILALALTLGVTAVIYFCHAPLLPMLPLPILVGACFIDLATMATCLNVGAALAIVSMAAGGHAEAGLAAALGLARPVLLQAFLLTEVGTALPLALVLGERSRLVSITKAALEHATQKSAEKSRFIAVLSHEIRTPMNGIIGFADLLGCTPLTCEQEGYVAKLQGAAESLLMLVNDLLDFSKAEAGKLLVRRQAFALPVLIEDVVAVARATPGGTSTRVAIEIDAAVARWVEGDPVRLQQVLVNLLANAITHGGGESVSVRVRPVWRRPDSLRFEIADKGPGIPPNLRQSLFEPFVQLQNAENRGIGTGLGLAICRQIVTQMPGGDIGITNDAGPGCVFWFELCLPAAHVEGPVLHREAA
jgi:signal transduction histidine kinase